MIRRDLLLVIVFLIITISFFLCVIVPMLKEWRKSKSTSNRYREDMGPLCGVANAAINKNKLEKKK